MIITSRIEKDVYRYKDKQGKVTIEDRYKVIFEYEKSDGKPERITKRLKTKSEAIDEKRRLESEHTKKGKRIEHRALLFRDYAESYKENVLETLRTAKGESAKVDLMIEHFGDIKLDNLRRPEIKDFKTFLQKTKHERTRKVWNKETKKHEIQDASKARSPRTVNTYLERLRAILREAETDEKILSAPNFKGLIEKSKEVRRDTTISYGDFERLLAACDVEKSNHTRSHLKIVLVGLFELGCRKEELQKILVKDIDVNSRIVKVWEGKRKAPKQRKVYITDRLLQVILENGILDLPDNTRAFGESKYYARSFTTAKKIAGIDDGFRLNDIRHASITNKIQSGMDLVSVQKQVGHSAKSTMTLDIYTNLSTDYIVESGKSYENYSQRQIENISEAVN